jgi:hypothetical protein
VCVFDFWFGLRFANTIGVREQFQTNNRYNYIQKVNMASTNNNCTEQQEDNFKVYESKTSIKKQVAKLQTKLLDEFFNKGFQVDSDLFEKIHKVINDARDGFNTDNHETIDLQYNGYIVRIDKKIAHLMQEIWKAGIHTCNSCEDNVPAGYIWIEFSDSKDIKKFLIYCFLVINVTILCKINGNGKLRRG